MFYECEFCHGRLDPGEKCDCILAEREDRKKESPNASQQQDFLNQKSTNKYFSTLYQRNGVNANNK